MCEYTCPALVYPCLKNTYTHSHTYTHTHIHTYIHTRMRMQAEELQVAMNAVGEIYGEADMDEMLDVVFRDFCIGK